MKQTLNPALARVFKRLHCPMVVFLCWEPIVTKLPRSAPYTVDARVQDLSLCPHFAGRYRANAHHCEGVEERRR
jgi:hypothetical protein